MAGGSNARKRVANRSNSLNLDASLRQSHKGPRHVKSEGVNIKLIFLIVSMFCIGIYGYYAYKQGKLKNRPVTPFPGLTIHPLNWTHPEENAERFWGSYRPGVYFGMRHRLPQSPAFGLMWMVQFDQRRSGDNIRHTCEQSHHLPRYGWIQHDGVDFGVQEIFERDFILNISFVKRPGGVHGGDWSARFDLTKTQDDSPDVLVSLILYSALDGDGSLETVFDKDRLSRIKGYNNHLGYWDLIFPENTALKYNFLEAFVPSLHLLKEAVLHYSSPVRVQKQQAHFIALSGANMDQIRQKTSNPASPMNLVALQATAAVPFSTEMVFESASFHGRKDMLSNSLYSQSLDQHSANFHKRFESVFRLTAKGFTTAEVQFAESVFSNLLGSIGYFYGASAVKNDEFPQPVAYWYTPLYTGVPSRSFFPRGFLWDEGFHQLVISRWSPEISRDVIGHWLDLMNIDGWIPREQILGPEALVRVPPEFIVQDTSAANPPALLLAVDSMLEAGTLTKSFAAKIYPRVKQWFIWYNSTQTGPKLEKGGVSFRWRGRNQSSVFELNPKTLTSGLDDYPRASHPSDQEYHLDLWCWISFGSKVLQKLAIMIEHEDDFSDWVNKLTDFKLLNSLHWSDEQQRYADYGFNSNDVKLVRPRKQHPEQPDRQLERETREDPHYGFVPHLGYVSLYPFFMQLIPCSAHQLGKVLADIENPDALWSQFGLRSLAKSDQLYMTRNTEHDPPYWRGQIWLNMNYLALRSLYFYANQPGPHAEHALKIYKQLRTNIVNNIYTQYTKSGYVWENYNDKTGEGQGSHPFTGWTSLIVLIMSEDYS
jgi:mannosyl-oligosaccharide glucosidase